MSPNEVDIILSKHLVGRHNQNAHNDPSKGHARWEHGDKDRDPFARRRPGYGPTQIRGSKRRKKQWAKREQ